MQLGIILTSLQDNSHVASLLGFTQSTEVTASASEGTSVNGHAPTSQSGPGTSTQQTRSGHTNMHLAEILMKTLLQNLGYHSVSIF